MIFDEDFLGDLQVLLIDSEVFVEFISRNSYKMVNLSSLDFDGHPT